MRIFNPCVIYKFQTVKPGCPSSQPHTFWSTAIRRDIRAQPCVLQLWTALTQHWVCSTSHVLTRCRIFLQLWTALS